LSEQRFGVVEPPVRSQSRDDVTDARLASDGKIRSIDGRGHYICVATALKESNDFLGMLCDSPAHARA
jgi:hypothetical protein